MLPDVFGEKLLDRFFGVDPFANFCESRNGVFGHHAQDLMKTDVRELDSTYELDVDLPGFKKEDVRLELDGGYLTISAKKAHEDGKQDGKGQYLRRERWSGSCSRSFYVGEALEPKDVSAKFENGILQLAFPKNPAPRAPENKMISIA